MKTKTHWKKVFNSDYLGSCDLEDGKDLKAVIKSVEVRKVKNTDGKEQERNVAIFTDLKLKPMILKRFNRQYQSRNLVVICQLGIKQLKQ